MLTIVSCIASFILGVMAGAHVVRKGMMKVLKDKGIL